MKVKKGLTSYPNIGAKVFVSSGQLVQEYMSSFGVKDGEISESIKLGNLVSSPSTEVKVNLQSVFGRHCAVVGTTGGGKSYTLSKLIESLIETGNKAILIDATGEYSSFDSLEFLIETSLGFLNITGTDLSLIRLDQEKCEVSIKGNIDSISYVSNKKNPKAKESVFNKLLK